MQTHAHILLVGPMGAGKTTLGQALAARLQRGFVDLDASIAAEAGMPVTALFANEGEAAFRVRESQALAQALAGPPAVIATGGGAVLAEANRHAMRRGGHVLYLQVDPEVQLRRLQDDVHRPLLAVVDRRQRLAELQAQREPHYRTLAVACIDTSNEAPEAVVEHMVAAVAQAEEARA